MSENRISFVREGLSRYAEARETIVYFQTSVYDAISRVFEAKTNWKNFKPLRQNGGLEVTKALGSVFIHEFVAGAIPARNMTDKVWLCIGLYWNPPLRSPGSVVAAGQCWVDKKGTMLPFNPLVAGSEITLVPLYKRGELRPTLDITGNTDLDLGLATLLDVCDEALGAL